MVSTLLAVACGDCGDSGGGEADIEGPSLWGISLVCLWKVSLGLETTPSEAKKESPV